MASQQTMESSVAEDAADSAALSDSQRYAPEKLPEERVEEPESVSAAAAEPVLAQEATETPVGGGAAVRSDAAPTPEPSREPEQSVQPEPAPELEPDPVPTQVQRPRRPLPTPANLTERGVSLFNQGRFQEAIDQFTKAIALDPNYREAWERRAEAYGRMGRSERQKADQSRLEAI